MKFINGMKLQDLLHPLISVDVDPLEIDSGISEVDIINQKLTEQTNMLLELKEQNKATSEIANTVKDYASAFIIAKSQGRDFFS